MLSNKKLRRWIIYLLIPLTVITVMLVSKISVSAAKPPATSAPVAEVRGVWLTNVASSVLFMPWGIERSLHQLAQSHFNTVYPVVWNRGYTLYPSATANRVLGRSQNPWLQLFHPGQDILALLSHKGQQHHLRMIPWFEYGFMAPARSELVKRHPDWLTLRQNGSKALQFTESGEAQLAQKPQRQSGISVIKQSVAEWTGEQEVWLNPLHPGVQQMILSLVAEVITKYDVSGIQFDDHFSLPVAFGYDAYTVGLYQKEHHGKEPPSNPQDVEWMRWRANKLSVFVSKIAQKVKSLKPDCIISLSPNPQGFAYREYLQDWQTWVKQGWIEELVLQVYRSEPERFIAELTQSGIQSALKRISVSIGIYTGTLNRPVPFQRIQQQVELAREHGFKGVSFFYWETLWSYFTPESPQQRRIGFQKLFGTQSEG